MIAIGERAPALGLVDIDTGEPVNEPWGAGEVALAFFKVSCPVCQMAAPKVAALAEAGVRVVAVGEDPTAKLVRFRDQFGQVVTTVTEPPPYPVSAAYGLEAVPSLVLVGADGTVRDVVASWDRVGWNRLAATAGAHGPISDPSDGLPSFRPG